jgi:hypothetical protein
MVSTVTGMWVATAPSLPGATSSRSVPWSANVTATYPPVTVMDTLGVSCACDTSAHMPVEEEMACG